MRRGTHTNVWLGQSISGRFVHFIIFFFTAQKHPFTARSSDVNEYNTQNIETELNWTIDKTDEISCISSTLNSYGRIALLWLPGLPPVSITCEVELTDHHIGRGF